MMDGAKEKKNPRIYIYTHTHTKQPQIFSIWYTIVYAYVSTLQERVYGINIKSYFRVLCVKRNEETNPRKFGCLLVFAVYI